MAVICGVYGGYADTVAESGEKSGNGTKAVTA